MLAADPVPIFVLLERLVPKKSTDVPMMTTRFTCISNEHLSMCSNVESDSAETSSSPAEEAAGL